MRYSLAVIGLAAALFGADAAHEQKLQKAIDLMESKGDLAGAMTLFEDAARSTDRAVAARALLYLAGAQERQGKESARETYLRITRDFGDQREIAAQARERLAALNGSAPGKTATLTARQLWTGKDNDGTVPFEIAPTPDGRSLLFIHWQSGDVAVRDVATGEIKRLGFKKSWADSPDFAQFALYSPDERQIAYTWHAHIDGKYYEFRIISAQSGAKPRVLIKHPELIYFKPFAWSHDGKTILTLIWKKDNTTQIAWVSAADGSFKTLKSLEWHEPEMISLSPDGRYIAYDGLERQDGTDRDIFILAADGSSEAAAVKNPGIDSNPVWTPDGSHLIFTSNRSRNFGLYAVAVQDGKAQGAARLLKPEIGRIALRGFVRSGALFYLQTTGDENVYKAELDAATGKLRGAAVPLASTYIGMNRVSALAPDGKHVAYVSIRGAATGPFTLVVKSLETRMEKSFSTEFEPDASPEWFPDNRSLLFAAHDPKNGGPSFYKVDVESGRFTPIASARTGGRPNHVGLSPDGETLYAPSTDRNTGTGRVVAMSLASGKLKTLYQSKERVSAVSLSPDGRTLAVTTSGNVLLMDTAGSGLRTLFGSDDLRGTAGIAWSSDGTHVLFVRTVKVHGSECELWRMPVNGGEPAPTGIRGLQLREIGGGPNGALTYTAGFPKQAELWALDNLLPMLRSSR